jgi:hypothetical protein
VIVQGPVYGVLMTMVHGGCMVMIAEIMSAVGVLLEGVCFEVT